LWHSKHIDISISIYSDGCGHSPTSLTYTTSCKLWFIAVSDVVGHAVEAHYNM